ncbi:MAG: YkgJ family cysteine cluster protein [Pseudomonadota bacterium]
MAEHVCVSCNMCCDGSMFDRVEVAPSDLDRMSDRSDVRTDTAEGYRYLKQGCGRLGADGRCGCYAERPSRCRIYNCQLVGRLGSGEIGEAEAHETVREMRRLKSEFVDLCRVEVPATFWPEQEYGARGAFCAMRDAFDAGRPFPQSVQTALFTAWFAYLAFVREHFEETFGDLAEVAARYEAQRAIREKDRAMA